MTAKVKFFRSSEIFRKWLEASHLKATEVIVGFHRKALRQQGMTYAEALDEALCQGWIDGVRRNIDAGSYSIRFTPRKKTSIWSKVNLAHVERLSKEGRMKPAGLAIHAARDPGKSGIYSFENLPRELDPEQAAQFQSNQPAWNFFQQQPPSYQRTAIWWVVSAKKEETRARRLRKLIQVSADRKKLDGSAC